MNPANRRLLVAGNWKMHGSRADAARLIDELRARGVGTGSSEAVVCPPFVHLEEARRRLEGSRIGLGAQDACAEEQGAYTGEVAAAKLADAGCRYVIVGHSERRALYAESDDLVARKFLAAGRHALVPILCVGESLGERERDATGAVMARAGEALALGWVAVVALAGRPVRRAAGGLQALPMAGTRGPAVWIDETLATMRLQLEKQNAQVSFTTEGSSFLIEADKLHITSVIYNLLDNVLKYSAGVPVIQIALKAVQENILELKMSDNGVGIAHQYQQKVFDKFFRVPMGNQHNIKGYGLGLSYVAEIVKQHMGYIYVESILGKGSTFIVKLPVAAADEIRFDEHRVIRKKTI